MLKTKYKIILIILFFLNVIVLNSINLSNGEKLYNQITSLSEIENIFVNDTFENIDKIKLLKYFIMVSEDQNETDLLNIFLNKEELVNNKIYEKFGGFDFNSLSIEQQKKISSEINISLHDIFYVKYNLLSDTISDLIFNGNFNCVSSSILYSIFLHNFNIPFTGVETKDHVFISIKFSDNFVDVETTNRYGFEPGTKKEFHDQFGKTTGFTYVPQKNYRDRNYIDLKKMFLLVSHNLATNLTRQNDLFKAAKIGHFIKLGRNDKKGDEEYFTYFSNFVKILAKEKDYFSALDLIKLYFNDNYFDNRFTPLRYDLMSDLVKDSEEENKLIEVRKYINDIHNAFEEKDENRFNKIQFYLNYKLTNIYNSNGDYNKSYLIIKDINNKKSQSDLLNNVYFKISENAAKTGEYNEAFKFLDESQNYSFLSNEEFDKYKFTLINNYVASLSSKKKYDEAILFLIKLDFYKDLKIQTLLKNSYINWGYYYSTIGNYNDAITVSLDGLKLFQNEQTILNNLKFYFYKIIEKSTDNLKEKYLNDARNLFPNEQGFK